MCRKLLILLFVFIVVLSLAIELTPAKVLIVVDGDTFIVDIKGKTEKVRLIGVDALEIDTPLGKIAREFTAKYIVGETVYLEYDVDRYDKYLRLLAYVWLTPPAKETIPDTETLPASDTVIDRIVRENMLNAILLLNGMAKVMTVKPNVKYEPYFKRYEAIAIDKKLGIWASTNQTSQTITQPSSQQSQQIIVYITATGKKYHQEWCRYLDNSKIAITLEEAKKRGYEPCKACHPPE